MFTCAIEKRQLIKNNCLHCLSRKEKSTYSDKKARNQF